MGAPAEQRGASASSQRAASRSARATRCCAPASRRQGAPPRSGDVSHARTFGIDVLRCACGGRLKVHSVVSSTRNAEEVLKNFGLWLPRVPLPPPRGPPQLELVQ